MKRTAVTVLFFSVAAVAIAAGVLADAGESRRLALLEEIDRAEATRAVAGRLELGGEDWSVKLDVWAKGDRRRVEFKGASRPRRRPSFGHLLTFARPGGERTRRRIQDPLLAARNYEVVRAGEARVAGRAVEVLDLQPRHPGRPSYRLSVDAHNRFPLAFEVRREGAVRFSMRFQEVEFRDEGPPREGRPRRLPIEEAPPGELASRAGFPVLLPARLPEGFELHQSGVIRVPQDLLRWMRTGAKMFLSREDVPEEVREAVGSFFDEAPAEVPVVQLDYTDGMASLTVVEVPEDSALWRLMRHLLPGARGATGEGPVVARRVAHRGGAAYVFGVDGTMVLVAGTVSPSEIEEMIRNFERRQG